MTRTREEMVINDTRDFWWCSPIQTCQKQSSPITHQSPTENESLSPPLLFPGYVSKKKIDFYFISYQQSSSIHPPILALAQIHLLYDPRLPHPTYKPNPINYNCNKKANHSHLFGINPYLTSPIIILSFPHFTTPN